MSSEALFEAVPPFDGLAPRQSGSRANRRRLAVFLPVFLLLSLVGLGYVFSRPAVYEGTARLNFVPAAQQSASGAARAGGRPYSVRDEVQFITSRTLLAKVWERLQASRQPLPVLAGADPAAALQAMLSAALLEDTHVVLLTARGSPPEFLTALLDQLLAAYQASLAERYRNASADTLAEVRDESGKLESSVLAKRREVDAFRARHNIVSLERDENQVLAEVKAVGAALNAANDKVVAAEARLGTLQQAEASGRPAAKPADNPTLAALEQQAAGLRADLREVARQFTPQYMQMDPRTKSLRERLAELEQQIGLQRRSGQQDALQAARDDLASARAAAAALRQRLAANQQSVQTFTSRFNEYRALQQELVHLEGLRQNAVERLAALEAEASARMPKVEVLEAAATPRTPASPWYARDAALALACALAAALLTMGIVELFNRPPPQPATVVLPQPWLPLPVPGRGRALLGAEAHQALPQPVQPAAVLPAPPALPRELSEPELQALLETADGPLRASMALLLTGLTRREVGELRCGDLDRQAGCVRVPGAAQRSVPLPAGVVALLPDDGRPADAPLLAVGGAPSGAESGLDAALLYAAHDAGIDNAAEVTAAALHHTYVAFLVRQGARFSELVRLVGPLPADALAAYRSLVPAGPRQPLDRIDRVLPAVRGLPSA